MCLAGLQVFLIVPMCIFIPAPLVGRETRVRKAGEGKEGKTREVKRAREQEEDLTGWGKRRELRAGEEEKGPRNPE